MRVGGSPWSFGSFARNGLEGYSAGKVTINFTVLKEKDCVCVCEAETLEYALLKVCMSILTHSGSDGVRVIR